jgi:hypothetical protein
MQQGPSGEPKNPSLDENAENKLLEKLMNLTPEADSSEIGIFLQEAGDEFYEKYGIDEIEDLISETPFVCSYRFFRLPNGLMIEAFGNIGMHFSYAWGRVITEEDHRKRVEELKVK